MTRAPQNRIFALLLLVALRVPALAVEPASFASAAADSAAIGSGESRATLVPLYLGGASLHEAMLASRNAYRDGRQAVAGAAAQVQAGPFYIDGRPDRRHRVFGPEATVRLPGVRLGGYNVWEKQPGANFHGALDNFRIYHGLLIEDQIRTFANE